MARLQDNRNLLGALHKTNLSETNETRLPDQSSPRSETAAAHASLPSLPITPPRAGKYEPGETVIGLECSYGTFAYSYTNLPDNNVSGSSQRTGCHNPIERPEERHRCDVCGQDYCSIHASRDDHDCAHILMPSRRS